MRWTYEDNGHGRFVASSGGQVDKAFSDEVRAWIYCAERNGDDLPAWTPDQEISCSDHNQVVYDYAVEQLSGSRLKPAFEIVAVEIDESILVGPARAVVKLINDAPISKAQAAVLLSAEESRRRTRATVISALMSILGG